MNLDKHKLPNKITHLNIYDIDSNSISIMVFVKVGSRYESPEIGGLAHFVEHNFFKGTKLMPNSKAVGMAIENLGGTSNAFTSYDYTGYFIKVPKENFVQAAGILADMLKNSTFPEREVEKERGVVIEEIRMYEDIPMQKVSQEFAAGLFSKEHPLGRDIAGTVDTVSKLSRKDIVDFTQKYYTGENLLVVTSGAVDFPEAQKIIEDNFGDISTGEKHDFIKFESRELTPQIHLVNKELEQTHLIMGGFGFSRNDPQRHAIKMGTTMLGRGFGSILFQVIREELGLAYYVGASHSGFDEVGVWEIDMGVDNTRVEAAVEGVIRELKKFINGEFDEAELDRARNYNLGKLITDLETSDDLARWYGVQELLMNETLTIDEVKNKMMSVTKDEVVDVWAKLVRSGNIMMSILSAKRDTEKLSDIIKGAF